MDEAAQKSEAGKASQYVRIKEPNKFGALLRSKRIDAGMSAQDVMGAYELRGSVLSRMEHASQKVFHAVIIERLKRLTDDLGITDQLVTAPLTESQWYEHCYKRGKGQSERKRQADEKKRKVQQEIAEQRRLEQAARKQEEAERQARIAQQPPGRLWIPPTTPQYHVQPPAPQTPPPETFPDLNDQMGQVKLFVKLNAKGILSDAALTVALRDLLRPGNK